MTCTGILVNPGAELRSNINWRLPCRQAGLADARSAPHICRSAADEPVFPSVFKWIDRTYNFRRTTSAAQTAPAARRIPGMGGCADHLEGSRPKNNDRHS